MSDLGNPVQSIRLPSARGVSQDRRLNPGEETALLDSCENNGGDLPQVVLLFLKTAMRRVEIAGMTLDDVNLKKRTAPLPETKNEEVRIVSLSSEAIRILSSIPRQYRWKILGYADLLSINWSFIHACKKWV